MTNPANIAQASGPVDAIYVRQQAALAPCDRTQSILWVHGYTMSSAIWDTVWQAMPEHHHVAIDLPGHGRSRALTAKDSTQTLARTILEVAKAFGIVHLVGLSFGGTLSLQAAIEEPDYFEDIILCAPGLVGGPEDPEAALCNRQLQQMAADSVDPVRLTRRWMSVPPAIFASVAEDAGVYCRLESIVQGHQWDVLKTPIMQGMFTRKQTARDIETILGRLHLLVGDKDMTAFQRCAELIRRSATRGTKHMIFGGTHLCLLLQPEICVPFITSALRKEV